jgi:hypothetical protein
MNRLENVPKPFIEPRIFDSSGVDERIKLDEVAGFANVQPVVIVGRGTVLSGYVAMIYWSRIAQV